MIMVIDMPFITHMADHAVGNSLSHNGKPTGVIYGSLSMLLGYIRQFKPTDLVLAWDSRHSLRREVYPAYKGNRKPANEKERKEKEAFHWQASQVRKALVRMGYPCVRRKGYEADDIIAEICISALDDVLIVAGDHDLFQLLRPSVRMWVPTKRKMVTAKWLEQEKGISPRKWAKVKAIAGCSSDNIKGVGGVGELSAIQYFQGTLSPNKRAKVLAGREIIKRNMGLVLLPYKGMKHVPIRPVQFDEIAFKDICRQYGFRGFNPEEWKWQHR